MAYIIWTVAIAYIFTMAILLTKFMEAWSQFLSRPRGGFYIKEMVCIHGVKYTSPPGADHCEMYCAQCAKQKDKLRKWDLEAHRATIPNPIIFSKRLNTPNDQ